MPGLPQLFDAMLLIKTILFDRKRLQAFEMFERAAIAQPKIRVRPHRFGGIGFFLDAHELCHLHGNGLFDAFVGMTNREELVKTGRALPHHVFPSSGWISFWIKSCADARRAIDLMQIAQNYRSGQSPLK